MNKKLIIGIVSGVAALAVIVVAIIAITTTFIAKDGTASDGSSIVSGSVDSSASGSDAASGSSASSGSSATGSSSEVIIEEGKMSIGSETASAGKTVSVPIKLSENPGIYAGQFDFEYDSSALTYVDYKKGDILDEYDVNATDGKISCIINAGDMADVTKNGTIITLNFKVKDDAPKGTYTIKLGSNSMVCNLDEETIAPKLTDGTITVK